MLACGYLVCIIRCLPGKLGGRKTLLKKSIIFSGQLICLEAKDLWSVTIYINTFLYVLSYTYAHDSDSKGHPK